MIGKMRYIMGFAGHMIDPPSRPTPRFPSTAESAVRSAIRDILVKYTPLMAVCSAACGGDIIFAEETLNFKIPTFVILPFENREQFIELSVAHAGANWIERFKQVCSMAQHVFYVNPGGYRSAIDFEEISTLLYFLL